MTSGWLFYPAVNTHTLMNSCITVTMFPSSVSCSGAAVALLSHTAAAGEARQEENMECVVFVCRDPTKPHVCATASHFHFDLLWVHVGCRDIIAWSQQAEETRTSPNRFVTRTWYVWRSCLSVGRPEVYLPALFLSTGLKKSASSSRLRGRSSGAFRMPPA